MRTGYDGPKPPVHGGDDERGELRRKQRDIESALTPDYAAVRAFGVLANGPLGYWSRPGPSNECCSEGECVDAPGASRPMDERPLASLSW